MTDVDYNLLQLASGDLLAHHAIYLMRRGAAAVQTEYGLVVDGRAGPITRAAIDASLTDPPVVSPAPAVLPRGKGMFIRNLTAIGTRAQMLEQMQKRDLSWVAIQRIWQYETATNQISKVYNSTSLVEYAEALRSAGHEVWLWGFPVPGKHEEFVHELITWAVQVKARGVILDPEKPFLATAEDPLATRAKQAGDLMSRLLSETAKHGLGVGMTSYGSPDNFPGFPWQAFTGAHFGMPQIYDANNNLPESYPQSAVAAWKARGFQRIVPASAAFNKDNTAMSSLLARTPITGAVCWWDWYNCSQAAGRWDAVQSYKLEA